MLLRRSGRKVLSFICMTIAQSWNATSVQIRSSYLFVHINPLSRQQKLAARSVYTRVDEFSKQK